MPAYNFKLAFAHDVEIGVKRQTIRKERKYPTKEGQELSLYTGMRTKACRLLKRAPCKSVAVIKIYGSYITVDGVWVSGAELEAMARADGFVSAEMFTKFFKRQYGLPFEGVLIKW